MQILIVDDEKALVKGLKYTLEKEGFKVKAAYDGQEALDFLQSSKADLIILDLCLLYTSKPCHRSDHKHLEVFSLPHLFLYRSQQFL